MVFFQIYELTGIISLNNSDHLRLPLLFHYFIWLGHKIPFAGI